MSLERGILVFMIYVLGHTKCYQHRIGLIQEMILQFGYKQPIKERHDSIQVLNDEVANAFRLTDTVIRRKLLPVKA
jgi:hypothetical protein